MSDAPPEGFKLMRDQSPFVDKVGPIYGRRDEGHWRLAFHAGHEHTNGNGVVHGGMLVTLVDQLFGIFAYLAADRGRVATVSLHSDFVAPGRAGDWIEARGEVTRRSQSLVFIRGALVSGDRTLMTASGTWKIRERE